jgi:hypothetical protein
MAAPVDTEDTSARFPAMADLVLLPHPSRRSYNPKKRGEFYDDSSLAHSGLAYIAMLCVSCGAGFAAKQP